MWLHDNQFNCPLPKSLPNVNGDIWA